MRVSLPQLWCGGIRGFGPHALEVEPFQDVESLQQNRALGPEAWLMHFVAVERGASGSVDFGVKAGKVLQAEQPLIFSRERGDAFCDGAAVEQVSNGLQLLDTVSAAFLF